MLQTFYQRSTEDEDIIQKYDQKRVCESMKYIIHHSRECCWSIDQAKRHEQPLNNSFLRLESFLSYISFLNGDIVVAWIQMTLIKKLGTLKLIKNITNLREWVLIFYDDYDDV